MRCTTPGELGVTAPHQMLVAFSRNKEGWWEGQGRRTEKWVKSQT